MEASRRVLACAAILAVAAVGTTGQVPEAGLTPEAARFDAAQLEQLAAPIALYPDSLIGHVLMASTYPIEVIEADRFLRANPIGGEALMAAIADKNWDPSVKALIGLPDVLKMMSENLDWMRDLGDAFLGQKAELLDAVQRLRARARETGTLTSTPQQTVTVQEPGVIVIESASPGVIYVPSYSPFTVYGSGWTYPYWYYPGFYYPGYWRYGYGYGYGYGAGLGFSVGLTWGGWLWAGLSWGWGTSDVYVHGSRYDQFTNYWHHDRGNGHGGHDGAPGGRHPWTHDPQHRSGVRYRDPGTARKFETAGEPLVPRMQSRGFPGPITAPSTGRSAQPRRAEPAPTQRKHVEPAPAPNRIAPAQPKQDIRRVPQGKPDGGVRQVPKSGPSLSGSRNPGLDRKAIDRGSRSRGFTPPSGGGKSRGSAPPGGGKDGGRMSGGQEQKGKGH